MSPRRKTSTILDPKEPKRGERRYLVAYSDDDDRWFFSYGHKRYGHYSMDEAQSQAATFAASAKDAIKGQNAPPGRVFRVFDLDDGCLHEFIVGHIATQASA